MIRVIVADDHVFIRDAWRLLLEHAEGIEIVAMAQNGREAVTQSVLHTADVVVIDISMPLMNGIEATKKISTDSPKTRVLMVSLHNTEQYIKLSLEAGAFGYLLKESAVHELVPAIHSLYQGNRYFSTQIAEIANRYIESRLQP